MASYKFEIFKDSVGEFRFRFKSPNGQTVAQSQGYTTKQSAIDGATVIKNNAKDAEIDVLS